jgi:hypothetical protein
MPHWDNDIPQGNPPTMGECESCLLVIKRPLLGHCEAYPSPIGKPHEVYFEGKPCPKKQPKRETA